MHLGVALGLLTFASMTTAQSDVPRHPGFPAHWWTPVSRDGAPGWEILPQDAGPREVILSKRHELGLLSNFAPTPFTFRGHRYASLEGFWQMMLYPEDQKDARATFAGATWQHTRDDVAKMTAFEAKEAGALAEANMARMGISWVTFEGKRIEYRPKARGEHYRLIVAATWEKVKQNPRVKEVLLSTGDLILRPDHHQERDAPHAWRYFEILTMIRTELRRDPPRADSTRPPRRESSRSISSFGRRFGRRADTSRTRCSA